MKKKKVEVDNPLVIFFVVCVGLFIFAPIFMKTLNITTEALTPQLGNISTAAGATTGHIFGITINMWDYVMIGIFVALILLMLLSSFLIDTSPIFAIVYIMMAFFLVVFAPGILDSAKNIWDLPTFSLESSQLPITYYLIDHFGEILVGVYLITGMIIYGKVRYFGNNNNT